MAKIIDFPDLYENELDNLLQWGRYLYRTSILFNVYIKNGKYKNHHELLYLSHSLLFVCIEAFKEYQLEDKMIDYLLCNKFENQFKVIKNLRNSIFHPERKNDNRQEKYIEAADKILPWAFVLLFEFERFLYFYFEDKNIPEVANRYRRLLKLKLGWLPNNSFFITCYLKIKKLKSIFKYRIRDNPEKRNELLNELKENIDTINHLIEETYKKVLIDGDII
jgi:hypothetical protein